MKRYVDAKFAKEKQNSEMKQQTVNKARDLRRTVQISLSSITKTYTIQFVLPRSWYAIRSTECSCYSWAQEVSCVVFDTHTLCVFNLFIVPWKEILTFPKWKTDKRNLKNSVPEMRRIRTLACFFRQSLYIAYITTFFMVCNKFAGNVTEITGTRRFVSKKFGIVLFW